MSWTEEQLAAHYERLKQPQEDATTAPSPDRLEAPIQLECLKILEQDGWRILITNPVSDRSRGKGFGEIGMADALAIRYEWDNTEMVCHCGIELSLHSIYENHSFTAMDQPHEKAEVMWLEFKRGKGGLVSKAQRAWHIRERARGALTLIAGEDFTPSVEGFLGWYRKSGLMRRPM